MLEDDALGSEDQPELLRYYLAMFSNTNISVIIPAYNEEKTVARVVKAAKANSKVKEIIVVNDGSADRTAEEVRGEGIVLLDYKVNRGKGHALSKGIEKSSYPIIVLLDADLRGLRPGHIDKLVEPLEKGEADLVLATIDLLREEEKRYLELFKGPYKWWHINYATLVTGQRAGFRKDFVNIKGIEDARYGVDLLVTDYYLANEKKIKKIIFDDVKHYRKPEKWGEEGWKLFPHMYRDIIKAFGRLEARKEVLAQGFLSKKDRKR